MMIFEQIAAEGCRSYLIGCSETSAAALIDPEVSLIDRYVSLAARDGLRARVRRELEYRALRVRARRDGDHVVRVLDRHDDARGELQLLPASSAAEDDDALAAAAKKKFSRSVGLSEGYFYFLRGEGKILSVSDDEVSIAVTDGSTNAEVSLQTGLVFGNALRDGTGLLSANDYPNSQDFNDISAALNHIVETKVLPKLRALAKVGAKISFVGCAEVDDESTDLKPLKVIPISTKAE